MASISREKQNVHEKWLDLERKVEKLQHDLSVKETLQVRSLIKQFVNSSWKFVFSGANGTEGQAIRGGPSH